MDTIRDITGQAFQRWMDGTGYVADIFADDMQWEIVGQSAASRVYADKKQFLDEVLHPFATLFRKDQPFRPTRIRGLYVDGETAVVFFDGQGTTLKGDSYDNTYAWFMTFEHGLVVKGFAFYDSIAFDKLWETLPPIE